MTLTDDRRTRATSRPARTEAPALESIPAAPVPSPARARLVAEAARDDVFRIVEQLPDGFRVVGYVQVAGPVFVTLLGPVYNTSVEIAQCLDLDLAVARLECATA
ncbi:hypothetical protein [Pseudolysinimonas sp.]|jgi:hypothetical protein|uniref:hypothetical protein n=1 Tax=Pseudolysinimonas sp. TaxID=2680009 RepID=UPI0037842813